MSLTVSPEVQAVFEERARALAVSAADQDARATETTPVIVLRVGEERYGVEIQHMREIEPLHDLCPLPGLPSRWAGVVNLRGSMYPVLDLRRHLSLPPAPHHAGDEQQEMHVALVFGQGLTVGLLVDAVAEIQQVVMSDLSAPMTTPGAQRSELFKGITPDMLSVLDLDALLADPTLVVEEEMK